MRVPDVVFDNLEDRIHFYFCLLVALRLFSCKRQLTTIRQKNAFIMRWLKNAEQVASFRQRARSEIVWLRGEILRHSPDRDVEPILLMIYRTACEMSET